MIFPEGRLNPDQQLFKANTGAVRLSLITKTPIIPVGFYVPPDHLRNIHLRKKSHLAQGRWQFGGHCYLNIGTPWLPGEEICNLVDQNNLCQLTDQLMEKIGSQAYAAMQVCSKETSLLSNRVTHYG